MLAGRKVLKQHSQTSYSFLSVRNSTLSGWVYLNAKQSNHTLVYSSWLTWFIPAYICLVMSSTLPQKSLVIIISNL